MLLAAGEGCSGICLGLALSSFAFACIEITSNLYLLDHITRPRLWRFKPTSIFACTVPLTFGQHLVPDRTAGTDHCTPAAPMRVPLFRPGIRPSHGPETRMATLCARVHFGACRLTP
jgi:hypothetical protein